MTEGIGFGEKVASAQRARDPRRRRDPVFRRALVSFMNAWLVDDFQWVRPFVIAFLGDFTSVWRSIRVMHLA